MIQPGLERISQLLRNVQFPWKSIHVAGTNGKGSVCHFASTLLTKRLAVGKFTSPHLVDRWDCITINQKPVEEALFRKIEKHYLDLSIREGISASSFEILTATAFHIFNEAQVNIGIVEVGMGGKLDATNVLNNQAVSVISKIAKDHEGFLGNTLEEIALHKAGILRPDVPYLVNPKNESNVKNVIDEYARSIGAGPHLEYDPPGSPGFVRTLFRDEDRPPVQRAQRENIVLAARAAQITMESLGREMKPFVMSQILHGSKKTPIPGRLESVRVPPVFGGSTTGTSNGKGEYILVDGAHNPDAAQVLGEHVRQTMRAKKIPGVQPPRGGWPVTWVLAMTEGKDAFEFLRRLLRPGDNVIATTFGPVDGMPWVKPMDPKRLLGMAKSVELGITGLVVAESGPLRALCTAQHLRQPDDPIVLAGSLYLVGDFHRDLRANYAKGYWQNPEFEETRKKFAVMLEGEKQRVNRLLSANDTDLSDQPLHVDVGNDERSDEWKRQQANREKRRAMQEEIEALDREMELLTAEEQRLTKGHTPATADIAMSSSPDKQSSRPRIHNPAITLLEEGEALPSKYKSKPLGNGAMIRYHKSVSSSLDEVKRVEASPPIYRKPLKDEEYKQTTLDNGVRLRYHKVASRSGTLVLNLDWRRE